MDIYVPGTYLVPNLAPLSAPPVLRRSVHNPETQPGTQPIRVLQHNLTYHFEKTNPRFSFMTKELMRLLNFSPGISYHIADKALAERDSNFEPHMPYLLGGKVIHLHETFLSYVWCISYALVTLYEERVVKPDMNREAGRQVALPNFRRIWQANQLMTYAQSLLYKFTPWDTRLPNPEVFDFYNEEWIWRINGVYLYAMTFILQHEFGHAQRQHGALMQAAAQQGVSQPHLDQLSRQCEREADQLAFHALKLGYTTQTVDGRAISSQTGSELGNLVGLCCLLFLDRSVNTSTTHPSIAERLDSFLRNAAPAPTSGLWGVACVALHLWAQQHGHSLPLPPALDTYQELYRVMLAAARKLP